MAAITIPTIKSEKTKNNVIYYAPENYCADIILDAVAQRTRFKELNELLEKIRKIPDKKFCELFTPHFYISTKNKNDAYISMLAIYYTIEDIIGTGSYIVQGTHNDIIQVGGGGGNGFFDFNNDFNFDTDNDLMDELKDKSNPHVLDEYEGVFGMSFEGYADSDPDGTQVLFFLECKGRGFNFFAEDESDNDNSYSRKRAAEKNFVYVQTGSDSKDEISSMLSDMLVSKGFDISKVQSRLAKLIDDSITLDEYAINSYARTIFNTHLLNDPTSDILTEKDFQHIKVNEKKQTVELGDSSKGHKIVGLENERAKITGVVKMLEFEKKRREKGLCSSFNGCNMVFAGPPGTAKTTLAREFASSLEKLGIIDSAENFTECKKSDIVGPYVGWTAMQVDQMFSKLASRGGGVIFFDEIYTLSEKNSTSFDSEAITCIVQNMENYRDKVFCIFAGYENKMDEFLSANPGIRSRIHFIVKFSHYDNDILESVFNSIAQGSGYVVPKDCSDSLRSYFDALKLKRGDQFGNGREARNLFSNTVQKMAMRLSEEKRLSKRSLTHFTQEDIKLAAEDIINSEIEIGSKPKTGIGF